jgi:hypothetical protein
VHLAIGVVPKSLYKCFVELLYLLFGGKVRRGDDGVVIPVAVLERLEVKRVAVPNAD